MRWMWSPDSKDRYLPTPYVRVCPGDTLVIDVASFVEVFGRSYIILIAMTTKPVMIAEVGSLEGGDDKATRIRQAFLTDIPSCFPRLGALLRFDENKERD